MKMFQFKKLSLKLLLILSFNLVLNGSCGEWLSYSTSVAAMTKLLKIELWLIETVNEALLESETKDNIVRSFISSVDDEPEKSYEDPEIYLSNPLNSFTLLRRMYEDWPVILKHLDKPIKEDIEKQLQDNEMYLPISKDMTEAAVGMNRIRKTYKLRAMDIAVGLLNGTKYDARLSFLDLYALGFELFKLEEYADAAVWLNASLQTDYQGLIPLEISNYDLETTKTLYSDALSRPEKISEGEFEEEIFENNCRGEGLKITNNLFCRYDTGKNHFHILAPQKMEELIKDPFIVIFHDVLTNEEIRYIKNLNFGLQRAKVLNENNELEHNAGRTTHSGLIILKDATIEKIVALAGLDADGFEPTRVLNYGLGGHYLLHEDYIYPQQDSWMEDLGDRIATMLLYLNDVEQGGAIVFPNIGLSVKPEKGALLLWYNLKNNGDIDINTIHGACPVIFGSKWVATIWVREIPQFRAMPCFKP